MLSAWPRAGTIIVGFVIVVVAETATASVRTSGCLEVDEACTLAELVGGGQIEVNDQCFDSFEIERQTTPIDLALIRVSGLDADLQQSGIRVAAGDEWRSTSGEFMGMRIGYRVRSLVPGTATAGHALDLVLPQVVDRSALRVDQTAYDAFGRRLGGVDGEADSDFGTARLADAGEWSERTMILGETDLFLEAGSPSGEAALAGVEIRYALPEPGLVTGLVFGAGLFALRQRFCPLHSNLPEA